MNCKNSPPNKTIEAQEIIYQLETTSCMGTCPVQVFSIFSNGTANYQGIENVELIGEYSSTISNDEIKKLKEELYAINFLDLKIKNNTLVKDLPTKKIYFKDQEKEKKLGYYHPKNEQLDLLIQYTNDLIARIDWKKK